MILAIDAGNTRWKWAVFSETIVANGALAKTQAASFAQELHSGLEDYAQQVEKILVSSVADETTNALILQACQKLTKAKVEFVRVQRSVGGVTAGYQTLERLGVDRWLAMLAAQNHFQRDCVIIDAGSAITVDWLKGGQHSGGLIAPGLGLMQRALFTDTAQIKLDALSPPAIWAPQLDTLPCVENGIAAMLKGFVDQVVNESSEVTIVVTGGDADLIASYIEANVVKRPYLVLEGLYCLHKATVS